MYIWNSLLLPHTPTVNAKPIWCCVRAAGCEGCWMCLWVRVFELSAIIILCLPPSELSKAHLGNMVARVCVCLRVSAWQQSQIPVSVKSPGVSVKVLIRLVQIKWGWCTLGSRGGGAIPLGRWFQIPLIIHQLGWINHQSHWFDWILQNAFWLSKGSMQICFEEWGGGNMEETKCLLEVWVLHYGKVSQVCLWMQTSCAEPPIMLYNYITAISKELEE